MPTIDELMEGKAPGSVRIRRQSWGEHQWFAPYYKDETNEKWRGLDDQGDDIKCINCGVDTWELYTQPKPKKVVYEWMYKDRKGEWRIHAWLLTEQEAIEKFTFFDKYKKTGRQFEVEE